MRRREFIAGLGGAAAWPLVARAQQTPTQRRLIGAIGGASGESAHPQTDAIRQGMRDLGYEMESTTKFATTGQMATCSACPNLRKLLFDSIPT